MKDNGVLCELVKVRDGWQKDVGGGGRGNELAGADRSEGREERVGVMPHCLDLGANQVSMCPVSVTNFDLLESSPLGQSRRSGQQGRDPYDQHSA